MSRLRVPLLSSPVRVPLLPSRLRWSVVVVLALVILVGSIVQLPSDGTAQGLLGPWSDTVRHFLAYTALALALTYATVGRTDASGRRFVAALVLAIGYGVLLEFVQAPIPSRHFSATDMLTNAAGATLGSAWIACERWVEYRSFPPSSVSSDETTDGVPRRDD